MARGRGSEQDEQRSTSTARPVTRGHGPARWTRFSRRAFAEVAERTSEAEIQPIIDGLAFDESHLGGLIVGVPVVLVTWFVTRGGGSSARWRLDARGERAPIAGRTAGRQAGLDLPSPISRVPVGILDEGAATSGET